MNLQAVRILAPTVAAMTCCAMHAATITVNIDRSSLIRSSGSIQQEEDSPAVGWFDADVNNPAGFNANGGYIFKLPDLPPGEQVSSVVFHAGDSSSFWPADTLKKLPSDLYGYDISPSRVLPDKVAYGSGVNQPGTKLSVNWFGGTLGALPDIDITDWVLATGYAPGNFLRLRTGTAADEATITSTRARWWTHRENARLIITTAPRPQPTTRPATKP